MEEQPNESLGSFSSSQEIMKYLNDLCENELQDFYKSRFDSNEMTMQNKLELQTEMYERLTVLRNGPTDDRHLHLVIKEFNAQIRAIYNYLHSTVPANFRETRKQTLRCQLVKYLCELICFRTPYQQFPYSQDCSDGMEFFHYMIKLLSVENEDINILILKHLMEAMIVVTSDYFDRVGLMVAELLQFYFQWIQNPLMSSLNVENIYIWDTFLREANSSVEVTPKVITFLPKGINSLKFWAEFPKLLSFYIEAYEIRGHVKEQWKLQIKDTLYKQPWNFFMMDSNISPRNPYEVLGVKSDCSAQDIKQAYIKLSKELHPDVRPGDRAQHQKFVELKAAYTTLAHSRSHFDQHSQNRPGATPGRPPLNISGNHNSTQTLLVKGQLRAFKILYCLAKKEETDFKHLIRSFLFLVKKNSYNIALKLEFSQIFDALLHDLIESHTFKNIMKEIFQGLDQEDFAFGISLFAAKMYDTYLDIKIRYWIVEFLNIILPEELKQWKKFKRLNCFPDMLLRLIISYKLQLKSFIKIELPILERMLKSGSSNQCSNCNDNCATAEPPPSTFTKKRIAFIKEPNNVKRVDCIKLLIHVSRGIYNVTNGIKDFGFDKMFPVDSLNELMPTYVRIFKYSLVICKYFSSAEENRRKKYLTKKMEKEMDMEKEIFSNFANTFMRIPIERIAYDCLIEYNEAVLTSEPKQHCQNFLKTLLDFPSSPAKPVFLSHLMKYFLLNILNKETLWELIKHERRPKISSERFSEPLNKQIYIETCLFYLDIILKYENENETHIQKASLMEIIKKSIDFLKLSIDTCVRLFLGNILDRIIRHQKKFPSLRFTDASEFLPLAKDLEKEYDSSHDFQFQNCILRIIMNFYMNCRNIIRHDNLSFFIRFHLKALQGKDTDLIRKALANLDNMTHDLDDMSPGDINEYFYPFRNDLFEGIHNVLSFNNTSWNWILVNLQVKFREMLYECENQFEYESPSLNAISFVPMEKFEYESPSLKAINFVPMEKVLKSSLKVVYDASSTPLDRVMISNLMECYLASSICIDMETTGLHLAHLMKIKSLPKTKIQLCNNHSVRETHKTLLIVLLACEKESFATLSKCLPHYVLVALAQQTQCKKEDTEIISFTQYLNISFWESSDLIKRTSKTSEECMEVDDEDVLRKSLSITDDPMDPFVIIDAIAEFIALGINVPYGVSALVLILQYSNNILGSKLGEFNLFRYLVKKVLLLCCEERSSLILSGCKMMEAILTECCDSLKIYKKSSKLPMKDVFSDFVYTLLPIIGLKDSLSKDCNESARWNLEYMCSLIKVLPDLKKEPFTTIIKILVNESFSDNQHIATEVKLCLNNIAKQLDKRVSYLVKPYFYNYHTRKLPHGKKQVLTTVNSYGLVMNLNTTLTSNFIELDLVDDSEYEEVIPNLCKLYLEEISNLDRSFVIKKIKEDLKSLRINKSNHAFRLVTSIYLSLRKKILYSKGDELIKIKKSIWMLYELLEYDANKPNRTLWDYCFIIIMFGNYFTTEHHKASLEKFHKVFMASCNHFLSSASISQLATLSEDISSKMSTISPNPLLSFDKPSGYMVILILNIILNSNVQIGDEKHVFQLAIPVLKYFPDIAQKFLLYCCDHKKPSFQVFFDFLLKISNKINFTPYLEESAFNPFFIKPFELVKHNKLEMSEDMIWNIRKCVNIVYHLCKQRNDFTLKLVANENLKSTLRKIWNNESFQSFHISQVTNEFKNFLVYRQLAYCLLEVHKGTGDVELLYELLKAPIQHFPESFEFLISYINKYENIVEKFEEALKMFLNHACYQYETTTVAVLTIPVIAATSISKQKQVCQSTEDKSVNYTEDKSVNYTEDLQIKVWQFILLPSFEIFSEKKLNESKMNEIHSLFLHWLQDYNLNDISEDLMTCLIKFSFLLLKKNITFCTDKTKNTWLEFTKSIFLHCFYAKPFCSSMGNFGILMQCLLGVRKEDEHLISKINDILQNSTNRLVIEECIYLLGKYVRNRPVSNFIVESVITSVNFLVSSLNYHPKGLTELKDALSSPKPLLKTNTKMTDKESLKFGTQCKKRRIETTHAAMNDSDETLNRSVAIEKTTQLTPSTSPGTVQESSQQKITVEDSFAIPKPPQPLGTPSEGITMAQETSVTSFDNSNLSGNHKVFFSMLDDESYFLCCVSKIISLTLQSSLISKANVCSNPLPPITILDHETVSKASDMDLPIDEQLKKRIQDESRFLQLLTNITHSHFFDNLLNLCKRDQVLTEQLWRNCFACIMNTNVGKEYYLSLGPSLMEKFKKGAENPLPRSYISFAEELLSHIPLSISLLEVIKCFMKVPYLRRPVCLKLEAIVFENNETGIIPILKDQCIDILAESYLMIGEKEFLGGLLKTFSSRKFENMEAFKDLGKRSADELSEWKFLTDTKFDVCNYVRHRDCSHCACACEKYKKNAKDELGKFIYVLCGNKMRHEDAYQNELSKLQDNFAVELQHIPAMFSTEHMELLKNCARVHCFKEAFFIMKKLVTEPSIPLIYETYLKPFLLKINQDDMFELDIIGARLRIVAYFISKVELREDIAAELAKEMKSIGFREFNKCYTKLAIESMKYGLKSLALKFQNKCKELPRDGIEELTENYIFYQKYLKNPFVPKGKSLLDWLNTICQKIGVPRRSNSADVCKAYLGKLLSASGHTEKATNAFQDSLSVLDHQKTHELFGIHLEKKFLGEKSKCLDDAKTVIGHLLNAGGYANENRIQILLTKILGLLAYDVDSCLEKAVVDWALIMPKYYWISMLPQLLKLASNSTAGPDGLNRLLLLLDDEYLQLIFFEFTALEYKSPTLLKTFNELKKRNPSLISNLESLNRELLCLQEKFCDESFIKLKALEMEICDLAYEFSQMMSLYSSCKDQFTQVEHKQRFVRRFNRLLNEIELPWAYRCQQVTEEMDLKRIWDILLELLEALSKFTDTQQKTSFQIQKVYSSRYLSTLRLDTKGIIMFGTDVKKIEDVVYVQKIFPRLEIMQKHNSLACKISLKGTDGKEYDYLVVPKSCTYLNKQDRIFGQLFSFLNNVLKKERTSLRSLHFNFFEVTAFPSVELIKYNKEQVSYLDICKKPAFGKKPILEYFKTLRRTNKYTDNEFRTSFFQEIERSIPSITLKDWAKATYTSSHDYWMFRRKFSSDIGMVNYAKYCFLLTYLNPNLMYIDRKTGEIAAFGLKLAELNSERDFETAVFQKTKLHCPPYQLTPNIQEFLTPTGIYGIMSSAIEITARCFLKNLDDIESLLRLLISSVLKNQTINRPTLKDTLDTIKTHDTRILPNWVQLVETTLPLSEADNYDELSGTFLFRQTFSSCRKNLWCLLCCGNWSFRSLADLMKHYNSIHNVGVIIKYAKFNKDVYFVPASMIDEQEDKAKNMSSSTDYQEMSSSTDCQKMSSSTDCQKMSSSTDCQNMSSSQDCQKMSCQLCDLLLETPSQVHEHYKNTHYKPARLVPKSAISNIGYYFHCGLCNKASRFFLHHHQHMNMEHNLQMHMCNDCACCKPITIDPKSHFKLEYPHDQLEECPVCSKKNDLTKHNILHHTYQTGSKSFACRTCLHSYSNLHQFTNHIPICPEPQDPPTLEDDSELPETMVFSCDECPFTFVPEYKYEVKQNRQKEVENYIKKVITLITGSSLKDQDIRLQLIKDSLDIKNRSLMNPYTHPWL